ncbi:MAG: hypothetical protein ABI237_05905 [Ginsengibacter sp.]
MKVKEVIELLQKQNPENELVFNSAIASSDANIPVGSVYENIITFYTFPDGKTYSYIPVEYNGKNADVGLTDNIVSVLTDEIRS